MSQSLSLHAAAKINLTLDILGTREDGYHLMQMVMQSVSLYDTVTLTLNDVPGIRLLCDRPDVPCDQRNIAWKAAERFYKAIEKEPAVTISIDKVIPSEAGLAGGSADGAAVLVGLNRLHGDPLTTEQLCAIGLTIGADLPFCIVGGTQLTEGIGEKLTPLPALPDGWIVIAKPPEGVATGPCFKRFDAIPAKEVLHPATDKMLKALEQQDFAAVASHMGNVLEAAADCPGVERMLDIMKLHHPLGCCMTGSGSAVIAAFSDKAAAEACLKDVQKIAQGFLVQPVPCGVKII